MGRHRYPCQSNTQVSYMTSEVVTPSTHPTGVLPASWQPHVWTCLISTSEDLVASLLLLSCFSLSCHRSNWCLRSGRAKANAIHLYILYIYIAQHLDQLSHSFGEISSALLWEWYAYTHAKMFLFLMTAAVKMKQTLSAMRHFRSHLNKRGFPLPYFPFPWEDSCWKSWKILNLVVWNHIRAWCVKWLQKLKSYFSLTFTSFQICMLLYFAIFSLQQIIQLPHLSSYNKHWKGKFTLTWMLKEDKWMVVSASV